MNNDVKPKCLDLGRCWGCGTTENLNTYDNVEISTFDIYQSYLQSRSGVPLEEYTRAYDKSRVLCRTCRDRCYVMIAGKLRHAHLGLRL